MATIKYNNTELDYDAIEQAALDGIEGFFNSMAYYKPGSKRKKYQKRREEDYEALLNLLSLIRTGQNVVVTPSDISWDGKNQYFQDNSPSRRMAYYISEKMRGMPGKTKPKLSRASLQAELNTNIGNITDLNSTYRNKALRESIQDILDKYTWEDLSGYDVEEGFDPIAYQTLLNNALTALDTPEIEDDAYAIGNRLGIRLPSAPTPSTTYTGQLSALQSSLSATGMPAEIVNAIMTQAQQKLAQDIYDKWLKNNNLTSSKGKTDGETSSKEESSKTESSTSKAQDTKSEQTDKPKEGVKALVVGQHYIHPQKGKYYEWDGKQLVIHKGTSQSAIPLPPKVGVKPPKGLVQAASSAPQTSQAKPKDDNLVEDTSSFRKKASNGMKFKYLAGIKKYDDGNKITKQELEKRQTVDNIQNAANVLVNIGAAFSPWARWARYAVPAGFALSSVPYAKMAYDNTEDTDARVLAGSKMLANLAAARFTLPKSYRTVAPSNAGKLREAQEAIREAKQGVPESVTDLNKATRYLDDNQTNYTALTAKDALTEAEQKAVEEYNKVVAYKKALEAEAALGEKTYLGVDLPSLRHGLYAAGAQTAGYGVMPYIVNSPVELGDLTAGIIGSLGGPYLSKLRAEGLLGPQAASIAGLTLLPQEIQARYQQELLGRMQTMGGLMNRKAGDIVNTAEGPKTIAGFRTDANGNLQAISTEGTVLTQLLPEAEVVGTRPEWMMPSIPMDNGEIRPGDMSLLHNNPISRAYRQVKGQITNNQPVSGKYVVPAIPTAAIAGSTMSAVAAAIAPVLLAANAVYGTANAINEGYNLYNNTVEK